MDIAITQPNERTCSGPHKCGNSFQMSDEPSSTVLTLMTVYNLSTDHGRNCNAFLGRRPSSLCCVGLRVPIKPVIDDRPVVLIDTPQCHDAEIKDNEV